MSNPDSTLARLLQLGDLRSKRRAISFKYFLFIQGWWGVRVKGVLRWAGQQVGYALGGRGLKPKFKENFSSKSWTLSNHHPRTCPELSVK